ncbi:AlpA family phage regulatory protein [Vibrio fluvialis]|uniref:helix-turn-helix transcriptional regulator n=1 Tax=Vibrio fluvialis TaxID=676 RepID=UPI001558A890|nr:AlpA family phage regulatory protein [Vibrio fluvialis]EKO3474539.1 AlpA family phage regulatory protein [Vibrio fluvialis]
MKILSPKAVSALVGRSTSTINRWWRKEGVFPQPLTLNGRTLGWREEDVLKWVNSLNVNEGQ